MASKAKVTALLLTLGGITVAVLRSKKASRNRATLRVTGPRRKAVELTSALKRKAYLNKLKRVDPETYSFTMAVNSAVKRKRAQGLPVARYDEKSSRAYLEYPDGRKEYVEA